MKFKYKHSDCIYFPLIEKHNLQIQFYPLGSYTKDNYVYVSAVHIVKGEKESINNYIKELRKDRRIVKIEVSKVIFTISKEPFSLKIYQTVYNPKLFYITPSFNSSDKKEIIEIASWDRELLSNLIKTMKNASTTTFFEILKFEERYMDSIYIMQLFPELPEKQKKAIELAYKSGYYQFPKKTNLDKLARIAKVSKQTFHENLKKAESRLMPLLLRE